MRITNEHYRKFLDEGIITTINEETIKKVITKTKEETAKSLIILLYYTGCRPSEALELRAEQITKEKNYITIKINTKKGGKPRTIYLKNNELTKILLEHAKKQYPKALLYHKYKNNYKRTTINKKGKITTRTETTNKLRYHIKKWFKETIDITPYYLRHNRFSKLAEEGVSLQQIQQLKGAKSPESVQPYLHMSTEKAKKTAKHIK